MKKISTISQLVKIIVGSPQGDQAASNAFYEIYNELKSNFERFFRSYCFNKYHWGKDHPLVKDARQEVWIELLEDLRTGAFDATRWPDENALHGQLSRWIFNKSKNKLEQVREDNAGARGKKKVSLSASNLEDLLVDTSKSGQFLDVIFSRETSDLVWRTIKQIKHKKYRDIMTCYFLYEGKIPETEKVRLSTLYRIKNFTKDLHHSKNRFKDLLIGIIQFKKTKSKRK